MNARTLDLDTADGPMPLYEARPDGDARGAVIVVQEAFGVNTYIEDVTRRFADAGYHAVAPHFFHRAGGGTAPYDDFAKVIPLYEHLDDDGILMDVDAARAHLHGAGWDDTAVGTVGFCFGGRVTFLAALRRKLGAAVGFYGGGIVTQRFPQFPPLVDEVSKLQTPWLGLFGDRDQSIPVEDVEQLRDALEVRTRPDRDRAVPGGRPRLPLRPARRARRGRRQGRLEPDARLVRDPHGGHIVKDMEDAPAADCDLCEAARITPWYHEDDICWIAECEICAVPMVVWRRHGKEPSAADLEHMLDQLGRIAAEQLTVEHYVDDNMRNIPDHFHAHARPRGGFFGHGFRRA